ncbi:DegT/DnrJ/EryC1/StrS aminotransferase family protein [Paracoccaceae bacterium]|nr:DegT/DnrJ/EryC1/StrS aminotransferase family protein [Paracoccaceae bacterium]
MRTRQYLPYSQHSVSEEDIDNVVRVLRGEFLTTGPSVLALEEAFKNETNSTHAIACSSGTAGLYLAYRALDLPKDFAFVVPAVTFLATASMANELGYRVIFADVDSDTGLMTADTLRQCIASSDAQIGAIIPVHLTGHCVDMRAVASIACEHNARIVEDACHALGGTDIVSGGKVGDCSFSDATMFSLHPNKIIAGAEGGIVTTNNDKLAEKIRQLVTHGMTKKNFKNTSLSSAGDGCENPWYYEMVEPSHNFRLSDIHSALAESQVRRISKFVSQREALRAHYRYCLEEAFECFGEDISIVQKQRSEGTAWHLCVLKINFENFDVSRAQVMKRLNKMGVGTQVHYIPLHLQPWWQQKNGPISLEGAETWYESVLTVPLFPSMTKADVEYVVSALRAVLKAIP